jgi:hypothetical protein
MADPADLASWTIKKVPRETKQKALKAANAADQTMGEWMIETVDRVTDPHTANQVIPPGRPEPPAQPAQPALPEIDLAGMAALLNATLAALAAKEAPKGLGRDAAITLQRYMRAARGLPPPKRRQTKAENGQTIAENGQTLLMIGPQLPPGGNP